MCKINGHSLFSYGFQPVWNWKKLATSKERGAQTAAARTAQEEAAKEKLNASLGDDVAKTAGVAKVNKGNKNQSLSSLRVPLENSVGASLGGSQALGLNLGG